MASGLFALLDDIATLLDDVSVMTKVAAKKTAGVLGDDLALNAQQVTGVNADRELPVVWAVAKGSAVNKTILVPAALAISALEVWMRSRGINIPLVMPLLMIGGAFLCFEGVEKLAHKFLHSAKEDEQHHAELLDAVSDEQVDMVAFEKDKIKGAVRTDFILSAEIIVISLGTVAAQPFMKQFGVLVGISVLMTVGVYGLVGAIVKIDDVGLYLNARVGDGLAALQRAVGRFLLWGAPKLMKFLSIAGTAAMFLVGGGIITHNIPALHHIIEPYAQGWSGTLVSMAFDAVVGILLGIVVLGAVSLIKKLRGR
jgi:predicted DNA repair protein MutK